MATGTRNGDEIQGSVGCPLEITWLSRNFGHDLWMWIREQSLELHVLLMSSPLSAIRPEAKCLLYI